MPLEVQFWENHSASSVEERRLWRWPPANDLRTHFLVIEDSGVMTLLFRLGQDPIL